MSRYNSYVKGIKIDLETDLITFDFDHVQGMILLSSITIDKGHLAAILLKHYND
jgi:hypothetical protein